MTKASDKFKESVIKDEAAAEKVFQENKAKNNSPEPVINVPDTPNNFKVSGEVVSSINLLISQIEKGLSGKEVIFELEKLKKLL